MSDSTESSNVNRVDVGIAGGGIAGLWLLNLLSNKGYSVVLFEQEALGCGQTLTSQGMIHGGLKYALGGKLTGASEAIANMPSRWRDCLSGIGEIDLSGLELLAERYYMFANRSPLGKLTTFLASRALRGRIDRLPTEDWPTCFNGFDGVVYALNDFVLDTTKLLDTLCADWYSRIIKLKLTDENVVKQSSGYRIAAGECDFHVNTLVSCAGNGNQPLAEGLGINRFETQQRPLKQVIVRAKHQVLMQAHCVTGITGNEPRLTITSRPGRNGSGSTWYLGGLLANTGVKRSDDQQIAFAQKELGTCVPWLNWQDAEWETLEVDRAEPNQIHGLKPDAASVRQDGDFLQCFPTKLTLTPDLGDKVLAELPQPGRYDQPRLNSSSVQIGEAPW